MQEPAPVLEAKHCPACKRCGGKTYPSGRALNKTRGFRFEHRTFTCLVCEDEETYEAKARWIADPLGRFAAGVLKFVWNLLFALVLVAILIKSAVSIAANGPAGAIYPVLVSVILFVVFVLEGVQTAVIQTQDLDPQVWDEFLRDHGVVGGPRKKILSVFHVLFPGKEQGAGNSIASVATRRNGDRIAEFLVGRQILTIISVVTFGTVLSQMKVEEPFTYVPLNLVSDRFKPLLNFLLFSTIAQFLAATLFQAWVSQLLPKILAKGRSIQMFRIRGAVWATKLCVFIGRSRAGAPVLMMQRMLQRVGLFTTDEIIPVGWHRYFNQLADRYGFFIERREISLKILGNEIIVTDNSLHFFEGRKSDTVRFVTKIVEPTNFKVALGKFDGRLHKTNRAGRSQEALHIGTGPTRGMAVQTYDSNPKENAPPLAAAEVVLQRITVRRYLDEQAEKDRKIEGIVDAIWSDASYSLSPKNDHVMLSEEGIKCYIEIGRPTRKLILKAESETYRLANFTVRGWMSESGITISEDQFQVDVERNKQTIRAADRIREEAINFPPMGASLELSFQLTQP